jgi:hypothetical protein
MSASVFVATVTPLDGLVLLVIGQFRATSKPHTARLRPFPAFRHAPHSIWA